jgi:superfamily II DNA or RNA helicase
MLDPSEGKAITAAAAIAVYTRLRQIETWPAGIVVKNPVTKEVMMQVDVYESQKLDYIIKNNGESHGLLPDIIADERVVIFSQFKEPLRELKRRCDSAGIKAVVLDGDTPDDLRNEIALDFDNRHTSDRSQSRWDVVLCNYRVGGIGLNFTAATQMIIVDEEWNPGKRDQAYDRIHRMGQEKPVTIHVMRDWYTPPGETKTSNGPGDSGPKGGIDVWLSGIIERKENLVADFNEATDLASAGLDALKSGLI